MIERIIKSALVGLIVGAIAALIIAIISAILPAVEIDASWWGVVIGVLVALYHFFNGNDRTLA